MKPIPISIQLYSLREEAKKDFPGVLRKVADIGYAGVEFAGLYGMSPAEVRRITDDLGLAASSTHCAFPTKDNVGELVDTAEALGYTRLISGLAPGEFTSAEKARRAGAKMQEAAGLLEDAGLSFGYHNHGWEFENIFDGKTAHRIMMDEAPGIFAQVDTYWAAVAGGDPAAIVRDLGERVPTLHIKDGPLDREKAMTAVGAGKMDWRAIIGACPDSTEWLVVELDRCDTDMTEAVAESYAYLTSKGFARGRK